MWVSVFCRLKSTVAVKVCFTCLLHSCYSVIHSCHVRCSLSLSHKLSTHKHNIPYYSAILIQTSTMHRGDQFVLRKDHVPCPGRLYLWTPGTSSPVAPFTAATTGRREPVATPCTAATFGRREALWSISSSRPPSEGRRSLRMAFKRIIIYLLFLLASCS